VKRFIGIGLAAALSLALVASVATAASSRSSVKVTNLVASYKGQATTQQNDTAVSIAAKGTGAGNVIGAGTITGVGVSDSSVQPCPPLTGTGKLTGKLGTTLTFKVNAGSKACGDEQGQEFSVVGTATVTKGTGKFKLAKGLLRFTGSYSRGSGDFSVKFTGKVTTPK
jgi:hypothetical protein